MDAPVRRTTYKAITQPMYTHGVTKTVWMAATGGGALIHNGLWLFVPLWQSLLTGVAVGLVCYVVARVVLKTDPAYFIIWWRAQRRPPHFDAAKRDRVEVWIV